MPSVVIEHPAHVRKETHSYLAGHVTIVLDGRDVTNDCIEASEADGFVVLYRRNAAGEICVTRHVSGNGKTEALTDRIEGAVHIIPKEEG